MKGIIILILIPVLGLLQSGLPKSIQKKVDKEISAVFEKSKFELNSRTFDSEITNSLPAEFKLNNLFEIIEKQELLGYAYVGQAPSKTDEFDFLIIFDTTFNIIKTKVLIYREDYGGEIGSKRWLKQFNGMGMLDSLVLNQNIVAISGATISVRSMTKAINDVLRSLTILNQKKLL